jgi:outer membrane lipopolysaccharide assembly protein LptE/RlpB
MLDVNGILEKPLQYGKFDESQHVPIQPATSNPELQAYSHSEPQVPIKKKHKPVSIKEQVNRSFTDNPQKTRAQNREAQRAWRERKAKRVKDLEASIADLDSRCKALEISHAEMLGHYEKVVVDLKVLGLLDEILEMDN